MRFYVFESREQFCDEAYIIEANECKYVQLFWCDDCDESHPFIQCEVFETREELWQFISLAEREYGLPTI